MVEVDEEREATASIRGYFYQLDAALLSILSAGLDDKVVVEGVEDFDLYSHTETAYHQVKYCESQKLTASTLRAPLFKLFDHFNNLKEEDRSGRKYILYGHYKEVGLSLSPLNCIDFKRFMSYEKTPKGQPRTAHSLLDDLTYEDSTIEAFCKIFEFRPARKYLDQKNKVVEAIRESQSVSDIEASGFHYPLALEHVAKLATSRSVEERTTTLRDLQNKFKDSQVVHHRWLLRDKGEKEYAKFMRKQYFSAQNVAGICRVFILEAGNPSDHNSIVDQALLIARKWSSAAIARTPVGERYAPFLVLRNAEARIISAIKDSLYESGINFVDGYPYEGSPFRIDQICAQQTKENAIALRVISDISLLPDALSEMPRRPCRIYDFFSGRPATTGVKLNNVRIYSIPIQKIEMISHIV